jgi:hypothetical protein
MITTSNTSRIPHNPSLGREGFRLPRLPIASMDGRVGESFTNPSRVGVKDLGGRKSLYRIYISLSSIYPSRSHTHARALRVRTREGVCEGFPGRIRSASPVRKCNSFRQRSHTFAYVGEYGAIAPTFPSSRPTRRVATRWPTSRLPQWQMDGPSHRYLEKLPPSDWPTGTAPVLTTVCFACPTKDQHLIQKGNAMSDSSHLNSSPTQGRPHLWHSIVAPTAAAIERFLWRVAWFGLFVWILFHAHA